MPDLALLTDRLRGVKMRTPHQALAFCPSHNDVDGRSLAIGVGNNGVLLVNCFAGCETSDVLGAIGMKFRDLYPKS